MNYDRKVERFIEDIKDHFMSDPIIVVRHPLTGKKSYMYQNTIWLDIKQYDYTVPIPLFLEDELRKVGSDEKITEPTNSYLTYKRTGFAQYHDLYGPAKEFLWEYKLVNR